jgi:hypothetical protein
MRATQEIAAFTGLAERSNTPGPKALLLLLLEDAIQEGDQLGLNRAWAVRAVQDALAFRIALSSGS